MPRSPAAAPRTRRALACAAVVAGALLLPGCPGWTTTMKTIGLESAPELVLPPTMPADFELTVHVTDQLEPAADYTIHLRRSGRCDYSMTARSPRRSTKRDRFDVPEEKLVAVYKALLAAEFTNLPARIPSDGLGAVRRLGVQGYAARSNDLAKEVQVHFSEVPSLEKVRSLALSCLPPEATTDVGTITVEPGTAAKLVGDVATHLFYPEDDARLADVPPERRRTFVDWYEAVNENYSPAPGVTVTSPRK